MIDADDTKEKCISLLEETPIVLHVCKRVGITRQTFYRWQRLDAKFGRRAKEALKVGRLKYNDVAESKLLKHVSDGSFQASKYWLSIRHPDYKKQQELIPKTPGDWALMQYFAAGGAMPWKASRETEDWLARIVHALNASNRDEYEEVIREIRDKYGEMEDLDV